MKPLFSARERMLSNDSSISGSGAFFLISCRTWRPSEAKVASGRSANYNQHRNTRLTLIRILECRGLVLFLSVR